MNIVIPPTKITANNFLKRGLHNAQPISICRWLCVVQTAGRVTFTVRYSQLFMMQMFVNVYSYFIKLCLFTDLDQTLVCRRYGKTNVRGQGGRYSEVLTLENHVDVTSFGPHDFSGVSNLLWLSPYHLTFLY